MPRTFFKKIVLIGGFILIISSLYFVQNSYSYGTSLDTAESITPGTYLKILYSGDDDAYYKIYLNKSQKITVSINHSASYDLDLFFGTYSDVLEWSWGTGTRESIKYRCRASDYYYIKVNRYFFVTQPGDIPFMFPRMIGRP